MNKVVQAIVLLVVFILVFGGFVLFKFVSNKKSSYAREFEKIKAGQIQKIDIEAWKGLHAVWKRSFTERKWIENFVECMGTKKQIPVDRLNSMEGFKVRLIGQREYDFGISRTQDERYVIDLFSDEGWFVGIYECDCFAGMMKE